MGLAEFMNRKKEVSAWFIAKIFVMGAFAGVVLGVLVAYLGLL